MMEHCRDDKLSLQRTEEITVLAPLYQATTTDCPLLLSQKIKYLQAKLSAVVAACQYSVIVRRSVRGTQPRYY